MLLKKDKRKILFFRESVYKVAEKIFNEPNKSFHLRGISLSSGISTTAGVNAIKELEQYGIVKVEKTPITSNIKSNQESDSYLFYKKIFNLYRLERYEVIKSIINTFRAKTVVLFGSFSKGEDIENSDIDILIISNRKGNESFNKYIRKVEKLLNRKINFIILSSLEKSSNEFKNSIVNGIVLHGYLKVI